MVIEGRPKYMTVHEFERPDVPKSEAWNQVRPFMELDAGSPAVFRRICPDPVP